MMRSSVPICWTTNEVNGWLLRAASDSTLDCPTCWLTAANFWIATDLLAALGFAGSANFPPPARPAICLDSADGVKAGRGLTADDGRSELAGAFCLPASRARVAG